MSVVSPLRLWRDIRIGSTRRYIMAWTPIVLVTADEQFAMEVVEGFVDRVREHESDGLIMIDIEQGRCFYRVPEGEWAIHEIPACVT